MPAILIGIGGTGGQIVSDVRSHVAGRVAEAGNTPLFQARAEQFRYLLVDTREENYHSNFRSNERFVIPRDLARHGINDMVDAKWDSDTYFREWWPRNRTDPSPFHPGDYHEGAGQIRPKGRLAYRLHLDASGTKIVDAVLNEVANLQQALNQLLGPGNRLIKVYVICSLGGGTGSGIALTLAEHLKQVLPINCALVGVFLLASVMEKTVGPAFRKSIYANTDAALREIDFFQTEVMRRPAEIKPFLGRPGVDGRIEGDAPPFDYAYLFGAQNRAGKHLDSVSDYVRLAAECLSTELFSNVSNIVAGTGDNFLALFTIKEIGGRQVKWASAGKSDLRYPVDRIVKHLSRRFGTLVIRERMLSESATAAARTLGVDEADRFLRDQRLIWEGQDPPLSIRMRSPLPNGEKLAPFAGLGGKRWEQANKSQSLAQVTDARNRFVTYRDTILGSHLRKQRAAALQQMDGLSGEMVGTILAQLDLQRGAGLPAALAAAQRLENQLDVQRDALRRRINGEENAPPEKRGLRPRVEEMRKEERWKRAVADLGRGFGRIFNKTGKKAKTEFTTRTWERYVRDEEALLVADEAARLIDSLLETARSIRASLNDLTVQLKLVSDALELEAADDLGENVREGVLNVGVLDDVKLVDHQFAPLIDAAVSDDRGQWYRLADALTKDDGGVRSQLLRRLTVEGGTRGQLDREFRAVAKGVTLASGDGLFREDVAALSVWDALKRECELRLALNELDPALEEAQGAIEVEQRDLDRTGHELTREGDRLLAKFISKRLESCRDRATAFWFLDPVAISLDSTTTGNAQQDLLVAYEYSEFNDFVTRTNVDATLLRSALPSLGDQRDWQDVAGKHSITIYSREGVVPLHWLNEAERNELRAAFLELMPSRQLYNDQRYYEALDPFIAPRDTDKERRRYILAAGSFHRPQLVSVRYGEGEEDPIRISLNGSDPMKFSGIAEADSALAADSTTLESLAEPVDAVWEHFSEDRRSADLSKIARHAEHLAALAPNPVEHEWWSNAAKEVRERAHYGRYRVGR